VALSELVKNDGFNTTYRGIPGRHYWFLWRDFLVQYADCIRGLCEVVATSCSAGAGNRTTCEATP